MVHSVVLGETKILLKSLNNAIQGTVGKKEIIMKPWGAHRLLVLTLEIIENVYPHDCFITQSNNIPDIFLEIVQTKQSDVIETCRVLAVRVDAWLLMLSF